MVRRLKRDLRQLTHSIRFPERKVVRIGIDLEPADDNELGLAQSLGQYTALFTNLPDKGCRLGSGRSCHYAGKRYLEGKGVAPDPQRAKELLTKACSLGEKEACGE